MVSIGRIQVIRFCLAAIFAFPLTFRWGVLYPDSSGTTDPNIGLRSWLTVDMVMHSPSLAELALPPVT